MPDQLDIFNQDLAGLTDEEAEVWRVIRERRGRSAAIKADLVAFRTRMSEVQVREIISHLVRKHGKLIASSTGSPPGFYVITNPDELRAHIRSLRHRGIMCLVRAAALAKTSVEEIFGQAKLEMEDHERSA